MLVKFGKAKRVDKEDSFKCVRDDGSSTWMHTTSFFIEHDLLHYSVETTLGYSNAFYGLLASGWDLESFEERREGSRKALETPVEARAAEAIVGLIQLGVRQPSFGFADFDAQLQLSCTNVGLPSPTITEDDFSRILTTFAALVERYRAIIPGGEMELEFGLGAVPH